MISWLKKHTNQKPALKAGLAPGSGVRGLAHIGALTAFQKAGITIDAIAARVWARLPVRPYALNPLAEPVRLQPVSLIDISTSYFAHIAGSG